MKLLQFLPTPGRGGCEEYALTIAKEAVRRGWEVHAAIPYNPLTASLFPDYSNATAIPHDLQIGPSQSLSSHHPFATWIRKLRSAKLIRRLKPTHIQIVLPWPMFGMGPIMAAAQSRIPTQVVFQLVTQTQGIIGKRSSKLYAWARAQNQSWITISKNNQRLVELLFRIENDQVKVVYNGADYEQPSLGRQELRNEFLMSLKWPLDSTLAFSVGRLDRQKGYDLLIQASPHLVRSFPKLKFAIAGEGSERAALEMAISSYGVSDSFALLGHRFDIANLLSLSDLFVFPTRYEGGTSFALVEAMASGLPILTSDASGIPEAIQNRQNGVMFRTNDPCDLLENFRWLLHNKDQWNSLGNAAKETSRRFSKERMLKETFDVFEAVDTSRNRK